MITPRVGVAGISFVHNVPGKEGKLVEMISADLCKRLMDMGVQYQAQVGWDPDNKLTFHPDTVLTILRREAGK